MPARPSLTGTLALISAFAALPAFGQTPEQFDLICDVDYKYTDDEETTERQFQVRYRIDLSGRQFCYDSPYDDCTKIYPIENPATASEINLQHLRDTGYDFEYTIDVKINRLTGRITTSSSTRYGDTRTVGPCVSAPFSGFPTAKF